MSNTLEQDYYVDEKGLAMFFEIQWLDKLREFGNKNVLQSKSKWVCDDFIVTKHFSDVANHINQSLQNHNIKPTSMLEVGSALGRTCYEMIRSNSSIKKVTVVEPSCAFINAFEDILINGKNLDFKYIKSKKEVGSFKFDARPIAKACAKVNFELLNKEFNNNAVKGYHDMVICLNVLDQCPSPTKIVNALLEKVRPGGVICLSCTYQWNKKHLLDLGEAVDDINCYFNQNKWQRLSEHEHEYKFRFGERYAHVFLAHLVIYQKRV